MDNNLNDLNLNELKEQKKVLDEIGKVMINNKKTSVEAAHISFNETFNQNPEIKEQIDEIISKW